MFMIMLNRIDYYRKYFWDIGQVEILRNSTGAQEQQIHRKYKEHRLHFCIYFQIIISVLSLYDALEEPAKVSQSLHPLLRFSAEIILPDFKGKLRVSTQTLKILSIQLPIKQLVITKKSFSLCQYCHILNISLDQGRLGEVKKLDEIMIKSNRNNWKAIIKG